MILGFLFGDKKTTIGGISLDILEDERYSLPGKVTRYPVEDGTEISDHIIMEAEELNISGRISHSEGVLFSSNFTFAVSTRLSENVDMLKKLRDARITFDVETGLRLYENVAFESLEFRRSSNEGGNWLSIDAKMVVVKKVKLRTAEVAAASNPASGTSTANRTGSTGTPAGQSTPSAEGTTGPRNSLLYGLSNGTGPLGNLSTALGFR